MDFTEKQVHAERREPNAMMNLPVAISSSMPQISVSFEKYSQNHSTNCWTLSPIALLMRPPTLFMDFFSYFENLLQFANYSSCNQQRERSLSD